MRKLILLVILLACFVYLTVANAADDNIMTIGTQGWRILNPDGTYTTTSVVEPTNYGATENCNWLNPANEKLKQRKSGQWKLKKKTPAIESNIDIANAAIAEVAQPKNKEALKAIMAIIEEQYGE